MTDTEELEKAQADGENGGYREGEREARRLKRVRFTRSPRDCKPQEGGSGFSGSPPRSRRGGWSAPSI